MTWNLTDHACRLCFGRLLESLTGDSPRYRCAECGHSVEGTVQALCCCGVMVGSQTGLECVKNPARSAASPQEIVVRELAPPRKRDMRLPVKAVAADGVQA